MILSGRVDVACIYVRTKRGAAAVVGLAVAMLFLTVLSGSACYKKLATDILVEQSCFCPAAAAASHPILSWLA